MVRAIESGNDSFFHSNGVSEQRFDYMVMEIAENGDLFEVLKKAGRFSENTARHFFKQIVCGLDHLHFHHSMCHLDMKLENVLIDADYNAKISDFGFVKSI